MTSVPIAVQPSVTGAVTVETVRVSALPHDDAASFLRNLMPLARASVSPAAVEDLESRIPELSRTVSCCLAQVDGAPVGFLLYRTLPIGGRRALQLVAACTLPEFQSMGVSSNLNAHVLARTILRRPWRSHYILAHIMNPVALEAWRSKIHDKRFFYPWIENSTPPRPSLVAAARALANELDSDVKFDPSTGVLHQRLLPGSGRPSVSRDSFVNRHFADHVALAEGDAVLMVVDASPRGVASHLGELVRAWRRPVSRRKAKR